MDQKKKNNANALKTNLLIILVLIVVVTVFPQLRGGGGPGMTFEEDSLILTAPDREAVTVKYAEILDLELSKLEELGTAIDGEENRTYAWGEWEMEEFGRCTLYVSKKIKNVICLTTADGYYVFNRESDEITAALYEEMLKLF